MTWLPICSGTQTTEFNRNRLRRSTNSRPSISSAMSSIAGVISDTTSGFLVRATRAAIRSESGAMRSPCLN